MQVPIHLVVGALSGNFVPANGENESLLSIRAVSVVSYAMPMYYGESYYWYVNLFPARVLSPVIVL